MEETLIILHWHHESQKTIAPKSVFIVFIMELPLESVRDCEIRAVIRFLCAKGVNGSEIHHEMTLIYGEKVLSINDSKKGASIFTIYSVQAVLLKSSMRMQLLRFKLQFKMIVV